MIPGRKLKFYVTSKGNTLMDTYLYIFGERNNIMQLNTYLHSPVYFPVPASYL